MNGPQSNQRKGAKTAFALAAILAALLFLASTEAFSLAGQVTFDPVDSRSGSQLVRQAMLGGLLLMGPLKAELLLRN